MSNLATQHPDHYRLSIHEAAHAVVSFLLNHRFEYVSMGIAAGHLEITAEKILNGPHAYQKNVIDLLKIFSAGQAGEELLFEKKLPFRSEGDLNVITDALKSNQLSKKDYALIYDSTLMMLRDNWKSVQTVAEGLRHNNVVTYDQVKRIIN
jgi:hypothetical protein